MSNPLQEAQAKIKEAIVEIDQERAQLQGALDSLSGAPSAPTSAAPAPAARKRRRKRTRKGKRAVKGQRAEQFLAAVAGKPGTTISEIAKKMGVERTSLYPVAKKLQSEKRISKKGSGFVVRK
jgi:DNA-binding NtrC family response regulator